MSAITLRLSNAKFLFLLPNCSLLPRLYWRRSSEIKELFTVWQFHWPQFSASNPLQHVHSYFTSCIELNSVSVQLTFILCSITYTYNILTSKIMFLFCHLWKVASSLMSTPLCQDWLQNRGILPMQNSLFDSEVMHCQQLSVLRNLMRAPQKSPLEQALRWSRNSEGRGNWSPQ